MIAGLLQVATLAAAAAAGAVAGAIVGSWWDERCWHCDHLWAWHDEGDDEPGGEASCGWNGCRCASWWRP